MVIISATSFIVGCKSVYMCDIIVCVVAVACVYIKQANVTALYDTRVIHSLGFAVRHAQKTFKIDRW